MTALTVPVQQFRALWPVTDPRTPDATLCAEALDDLTAVAWRHGCRVVSHGAPRIREGRFVPGSGGAARVVTIDAHVVRVRDLPGVAA